MCVCPVHGRETKFREVKNQIAIVRSSEYGATKQAFDDRAARQVRGFSFEKGGAVCFT
jgi:hypothetical protein